MAARSHGAAEYEIECERVASRRSTPLPLSPQPVADTRSPTVIRDPIPAVAAM